METSSRIKLDPLLEGAIDLHVHSAPDSVGRWGDSIDIARLAAEMGMRGVVFKDHFRSAGVKAALTQKVVPDLKIFGVHACNHPNGGMSARSVIMAIHEGAKVIMMPTMDSLAQHSRPRRGHLFTHFLFGQKVDPISIYSPGTQELTDELCKILELVAKHDLVLSNGHLAPEETIALFRRAISMGVKPHRCMVEHPNGNPAYTMENMKVIADMGAYLNISYNACNPLFAARDPKEAAEIVKTVGPESCNIITDGGQLTSPAPAEGLRVFCHMLMFYGVERPAIEMMIKANPARVLGLDEGR